MAVKHRLSDGLGVALDGIDLSKPLSDAAFREIEQAFWEGQVLAIKGQRLEPARVPRLRAPLRQAGAARH